MNNPSRKVNSEFLLGKPGEEGGEERELFGVPSVLHGGGDNIRTVLGKQECKFAPEICNRVVNRSRREAHTPERIPDHIEPYSPSSRFSVAKIVDLVDNDEREFKGRINVVQHGVRTDVDFA